MNNKLLTNNIIFNRYIIDRNKISVYDIYKSKECKQYKYYKYLIFDNYGNKKIYSYRQLYKLAYNKLFIIDNIKDLDGEEWREIPFTNKKYYISNYGRVKSYKYYNARLLKPVDNGKGYYRIDINRKKYLIHKLVMYLFNYNVFTNNYDIHHKDHNKYNNNLDNLEYLEKNIHRQIEKEYRQSLRKGI